MSIVKLASLVEIRTKAASMIPFVMGTLYAIYYFKEFHLLNFLLMFFSLLCIDMATTAINNYYDFKKAKKKSGYGYDTHNAIVKYQLNEWVVLGVIGLLFCTATVLGIFLVLHTDLVVLALGFISFGIGILYSFGPIPISRLPLGEAFSGLFMGFLIIFISVYIHLIDLPIAQLTYQQGMLSLSFDVIDIAMIFAFSIPAICGIANIMLANNICDREEDIENRRYTLPVYIGNVRALLLYRLLYVASYLDIILLFFIGVHPVWLVLILLTILPLRRNIAKFVAKQSKAETFGLAVKNFMLICGTRVIVLVLSILIW
jgi:1,4-dihydroxy-2-naphthoate octaprenyltransferase